MKQGWLERLLGRAHAKKQEAAHMTEPRGPVLFKVNVNLPNAHFRVHQDPDCIWYLTAGDRGTRVIRVDPASLPQWLEEIGRGEYRFAAQKGLNAMWIEFSFPDRDSAMAAIAQVKSLLDRRHKPIRRVAIEVHCRG